MRKVFTFTAVFLLLLCLLSVVQAEEYYTIYYSDTDEGHFSEIKTEVPVGDEYVTIMTISQLGDDYAETGRDFIGWKAYNPGNQTWYVQNNSTGQKSWLETDGDGNLPVGYDYFLFVNGAGVRRQTTAGGRINLYAQWDVGSYTIYFSESDNDVFSDLTTAVPLGTEYTTILSIGELGFDSTGRSFQGWKAYNCTNNTWYVQADETGQKSWQETDEDGNLPAGYHYYLYVNEAGVRKQAASGSRINFYAQWIVGSYTIYYSESDSDGFSAMVTEVSLGDNYTKTLTINELEFAEIGRIFMGWKAYRTVDHTWYAQSDNGERRWVALDADGTLPSGFTYFLYGNGAEVRNQSTLGGRICFYAQWNTDGNEIVYYSSEDGVPLETTTHLLYDIPSELLTIEELGLETEGEIFLGWKAQRASDNRWIIIHSDGTATWEVSPAQGDEYYLYQDGETVRGYFQSGEIRYYAQWLSVEMDVTESIFGANGEDQEDDRMGIQKALNMAKRTSETITVNIPAGQYYISDSLIVFSNTKLILDDNATITCLNATHLMVYNGSLTEDPAGGYERSSNITIRGGIWDGNGQSGEINSSLIMLVHASQVTISNVYMKNCCGNHFIDFAGVSNAQITGCTFRDFIHKNGINYTDDTQNGMSVSIMSEAIQLDYTTADSSGEAAAPYDNTACKNITVTGCHFVNCLSGIGNHHAGSLTYGYRIQDNTFSNMESYCINMFSAGGAQVYGNTASNVSGFVLIYLCDGGNNSNIIVASNEINNTNAQKTKNGIMILESEGVVANKNQISGFTNGIQVASESTCILLTENIISNMSENGIRIADSVCDVEGNTISNITENGIRVANATCDIFNNTLTTCSGYNIVSYGASSGSIEGNAYDLPYGIRNYGNMTRGVNNYIYADTECDYFTVVYHQNDEAEPAEQTTTVIYGVGADTLTVEELGFRQDGKVFVGWKLYRNDSKSWGIMDQSGDLTWEDNISDEDTFKLFTNGVFVKATVETGAELHFYAQWEAPNGKLIIPEDTIRIESEAFYGLDLVGEVILGNNTVAIESRAFAGMKGLQYITIPDSVSDIASDAFEDCTVIIRCSKESFAKEYAEERGFDWEEIQTDHE